MDIIGNDLDIEMLSLIKKQLNFENLLHKKYLTYAEMCYDSELKNICYEAGKRHLENYKRLLSYLENQ
jgi:hypothetical protein